MFNRGTSQAGFEAEFQTIKNAPLTMKQQRITTLIRSSNILGKPCLESSRIPSGGGNDSGARAGRKAFTRLDPKERGQRTLVAEGESVGSVATWAGRSGTATA